MMCGRLNPEPMLTLSLRLISALAVLTAVLAGAQRPPNDAISPASTSTTLVVRDVTVVDVEHARLLRKQTVVIEGSRITALGPTESLRVPTGASIVEGAGRFLAPGFVDMHVRLYTEGDLVTYVTNEVTTVRNMAGDSTHLDFRARAAAGRLVAPRIITAGPVVEASPLRHPDNHAVDDAGAARREIEQQRAAGYDFVKVYNWMAPAVYEAVVTAARQAGLPVAGHVPFEVGLAGALAARQSSIEHLRGYLVELLPPLAAVQPTASFRDRSVAWNNIDPARFGPLAARTAAAGVWNCPTLVFSVHEMSPAAAHARLLSRAEVRHLSLRGLPDRSTERYLAGFTDADYAATQRGLAAQSRLVRELDAAGAGLLVGTDSWLAGFAFADELELLVGAGLSPARVLRMATLDAARFLANRNYGEASRSAVTPIWSSSMPTRSPTSQTPDGYTPSYSTDGCFAAQTSTAS
ncbi:MAG: amidohydrolase family protein [Acidobacteriota bacterium]|nr:amidohydrolase family protein [Acidobacteriota bacterium]